MKKPPPPPPIVRWTAGRKVLVLAAIAGKQLTIEEACERYELSEEEVAGWFAAFKSYGAAGLKVTQRPEPLRRDRIILRRKRRRAGVRGRG